MTFFTITQRKEILCTASYVGSEVLNEDITGNFL
jgi:hypothetical protein